MFPSMRLIQPTTFSAFQLTRLQKQFSRLLEATKLSVRPEKDPKNFSKL